MNQYLNKYIETNFSKPGKALDLGFGKGHDLAYLQYLGWECEGADKHTGVDLEKVYESPNKPFDLVYSNYVAHKLDNPLSLLYTAYNNLKPEGHFFLHTFDESKNGSICSDLRYKMEKIGFSNIQATRFEFFDNEPGHHHWHTICQITTEK